MQDPLSNEPHLTAALAKAASFAPGFAGAVLSLAFVDKLTIRGRMLAVFVGICAAAYLAPALADFIDLFWPGDMPRSVRSAAQFLVGLCAMGCIPPLLTWLKKIAGDPLSLIKVRIGGGAQP